MEPAARSRIRAQKTLCVWQAMPSQPVVKSSCCVHENTEYSKHHRSDGFLKNVGASDKTRQAVVLAFWRFNPPRPRASVQLRGRFCVSGSAINPVFLYTVRTEWR